MTDHLNETYTARLRSHRKPSRSLLICALIGFIVFALFQIIIPMSISGDDALVKPITKEEALDRALQMYSEEPFSSVRSSTVPMVSAVIYDTNSLLAGYINKEQLQKSYEPWEELAPYDVYRVLIQRGNLHDLSYSIMDIHMTTGKLVSYQTRTSDISAVSAFENESEMLLRSDQAIRELGYSPSQVYRLPLSEQTPNVVNYQVPSAVVGDAHLTLNVTWNGDQLLSVKPVWDIPESYMTQVNKQISSAQKVQLFAYEIMSIIMGIAAIICAIVYRRSIHFRSKTILIVSVISCLISIVHIWNYMPSVVMLEQLVPISATDIRYGLILSSCITIIQGGIILYLSIVAGSALWKRSGYSHVMPAWSHQNFGQSLVQAFWRGLCWAGILLGIQTFIFTGLELSVGAWSTTDSSSAPVNLKFVYAYPLLAWVAAISEEGIFRLFGVGLLRRWIPNLWIAALIPTFVWAAGHVTYPIFPFYSRPIELMIMGLIFVWIIVRYDFWTAVAAHLMLDTILMVISLLLERTLLGITFGILYLLLPAIVVYGISYLHKNKRQSVPL